MHLLCWATFAWSTPTFAEEPASTDASQPRPVFSIEPIKLGSLMLNLHPDWAAWGIESGVRVSDHLWLQLFFEYDKGGAQLGTYFVDGSAFLVTHGYTAVLPTARWYFSPEGSSGFVDAGFAWQRGRQQYFDVDRELQERTGFTLSPVLMSGYQAEFGRGLFFKVRGGGGWNAVRGGDIDGHLDLYERQAQARTYYSPHTHLTEVFFQPFFYVFDVAFGAEFGRRARKTKSSR
ncbi:MAG: hypothetical protein AAF602_24140 [Myxococcota bacterium]